MENINFTSSTYIALIVQSLLVCILVAAVLSSGKNAQVIRSSFSLSELLPFSFRQ